MKPSEDTLPDLSRDFLSHENLLHSRNDDDELDLSDCEDEPNFGRDEDEDEENEDEDALAFRRMPCLEAHELKGLLQESLSAYNSEASSSSEASQSQVFAGLYLERQQDTSERSAFVNHPCLGEEQMLLLADQEEEGVIESNLQRVNCFDEKDMDIVFFESIQSSSTLMKEAAAAGDGNGPPGQGNDFRNLDTIEEGFNSETSEIIDWCLDLVDKAEKEYDRFETLNSVDLSSMRAPCLNEQDMNYFCSRPGALQVGEEVEEEEDEDARLDALNSTHVGFMKAPCLDGDDMEKLLVKAGFASSDENARLNAMNSTNADFMRTPCLDGDDMEKLLVSMRSPCLDGEDMEKLCVQAGFARSDDNARLNALNSTNADFMRTPCLDGNDMNQLLISAGVIPSRSAAAEHSTMNITLKPNERARLNNLNSTDVDSMRAPCLDGEDMDKFLDKAGFPSSAPAAADLTEKTTANMLDDKNAGWSSSAASSKELKKLRFGSGDQAKWWHKDAGLNNEDSWGAKFLKRRFRGGSQRLSF
jgi:hypothetical protein